MNIQSLRLISLLCVRQQTLDELAHYDPSYNLTSAAPDTSFNQFVSYFFFQAEDGIRDHCVTGVQTCALPISIRHLLRRSSDRQHRLDQPTRCRPCLRTGVGYVPGLNIKPGNVRCWVKMGGEDAPTKSLRGRSEEHTSELQSHSDLVCRLLLEK